MGVIYCPDCGRRMGIIGGNLDKPGNLCSPCKVKAKIRAHLPEPVRSAKTGKKRGKGGSVRTVSGGLPGLGKRRQPAALNDSDRTGQKPRTHGPTVLPMSHWFRTIADDSGIWHVSTIGYEYRMTQGTGSEIAAWHWHPAPLTGADFPHLHIAGDPLTRKAHLPTGRVSMESVLRLLIDDLGVRPLRDDHAEVLDLAERDFIEHRRMHA